MDYRDIYGTFKGQRKQIAEQRNVAKGRKYKLKKTEASLKRVNPRAPRQEWESRKELLSEVTGKRREITQYEQELTTAEEQIAQQESQVKQYESKGYKPKKTAEGKYQFYTPAPVQKKKKQKSYEPDQYMISYVRKGETKPRTMNVSGLSALQYTRSKISSEGEASLRKFDLSQAKKQKDCRRRY